MNCLRRFLPRCAERHWARLFFLGLLLAIGGGQGSWAADQAPPKFRYYFPDAAFHTHESDDRVPAADQSRCCVQRDEAGFDIAFIEFDQRGDFWNRDQLATARHQLKERTKGKKPLLIEYVHGWHNNAQEDPNRDVHGFRTLLGYLAKSEYLKKQGYHVFGVYLGWRGEQIRHGRDPLGLLAWLPSQLSFYPTKQIGTEVGTMPMISEALFWMVSEARRQTRDAKTVLIGHSFGAMVLENAIAQAVASSAAMNVGEGSLAPADLILLLNSAANSLRAKGTIEMLERMGKSGNLRFVDENRPLIVSVTSEGDFATGKFYPFGTGLSNITKGFRSYDEIGLGHEVPKGTTQRDFVTQTPGNNRLLVSHTMKIDPTLAPTTRQAATGENGLETFERNLESPLSADPKKGKWPFRSLARGGGECRSTIQVSPEALMRTGYWVVRVPKEIIYDHGDIFNEQALCLYAAIFRVENPKAGKLSPGPRWLMPPAATKFSSKAAQHSR